MTFLRVVNVPVWRLTSVSPNKPVFKGVVVLHVRRRRAFPCGYGHDLGCVFPGSLADRF
jgi:hypothetical protein